MRQRAGRPQPRTPRTRQGRCHDDVCSSDRKTRQAKPSPEPSFPARHSRNDVCSAKKKVLSRHDPLLSPFGNSVYSDSHATGYSLRIRPSPRRSLLWMFSSGRSCVYLAKPGGTPALRQTAEAALTGSGTASNSRVGQRSQLSSGCHCVGRLSQARARHSAHWKASFLFVGTFFYTICHIERDSYGEVHHGVCRARISNDAVSTRAPGLHTCVSSTECDCSGLRR